MILNSKKNLKEKRKSTLEVSNYLQMQNGSAISNTYEFPMKPFEGTKHHLEKCDHNEKPFKSSNKRKANGNSNELHIGKEKKSKYDPLQVMRKLEEFSDVWNDCPDVENPKSNFEVVSNPNRESVCEKANKFEHKNKGVKGSDVIKWSIPNGGVEDTLKTNDHRSSYKNKDNILQTEVNKTNNSEDEKVDDGLTVHVKYDSKLAESKRKKAVQEQSQLHAEQKNIIKKALSSMDGKQQVNKKIVFSDAENDEKPQMEVKTKTNKLFGDNDDDTSDADIELKINSQFEGKKGKKLLELQSKFASDSRFVLDSRFHDSESENEKNESPSDNLDIHEEKKRQLEILESIVNQPIRPISERKKVSSKKYDESLMVRFDPTREDHQKYLLKPQKCLQEKEVKEKIKKSKKESKSLPNLQESKPEVSSERIYDVKEDLKQVLKKENKTEFSLLKLFGSKDEESPTQQEGSESIKKLKYATKNPFRYDSSESESEEEERKVEESKNQKSSFKPSFPSWRTTFFFTDNDSRLKEAEEFLKGPAEPKDEQEYAEKRKILKDFIRHKMKNSNRKKDPFKRKLGGIKKKALHRKKGK